MFDPYALTCDDARLCRLSEGAVTPVFHPNTHYIPGRFLDVLFDLVAGESTTDRTGHGRQIFAAPVTYLMAQYSAKYSAAHCTESGPRALHFLGMDRLYDAAVRANYRRTLRSWCDTPLRAGVGRRCFSVLRRCSCVRIFPNQGVFFCLDAHHRIAFLRQGAGNMSRHGGDADNAEQNHGDSSDDHYRVQHAISAFHGVFLNSGSDCRIIPVRPAATFASQHSPCVILCTLPMQPLCQQYFVYYNQCINDIFQAARQIGYRENCRQTPTVARFGNIKTMIYIELFLSSWSDEKTNRRDRPIRKTSVINRKFGDHAKFERLNLGLEASRLQLVTLQ